MLQATSGFESFLEVARLLNSSLDVHTVLRRLLEGVERLLAPTHWSCLLRDEESDELVFSLVAREVDRELVGQRLGADEGIAGWAASRGESLLIRDAASDRRFSPRMDRALGFATRSIIAVPLRTAGKVIGVIELINGLDGREFTERDVELLEGFADFAAVALENARAHGALLESSRNDPLTGLRNSAFFLSCVDRAVDLGRPFALVFFDMDRFKPLVDTHGHLRGSAALQEVGVLVSRSLRDGDVGCRFGGDEFAFLLSEADGAGAARRARELADHIEAHLFLEREGIRARLSASFGWAAYPADAGAARELLQLADERMYERKRAQNLPRER